VVPCAEGAQDEKGKPAPGRFRLRQRDPRSFFFPGGSCTKLWKFRAHSSIRPDTSVAELAGGVGPYLQLRLPSPRNCSSQRNEAGPTEQARLTKIAIGEVVGSGHLRAGHTESNSKKRSERRDSGGGQVEAVRGWRARSGSATLDPRPGLHVQTKGPAAVIRSPPDSSLVSRAMADDVVT